ncbi:MAG TPA: hypothetical protein ENN43_01785, partial [bacterium]|nr:hypothetical protein [bacterium]
MARHITLAILILLLAVPQAYARVTGISLVNVPAAEFGPGQTNRLVFHLDISDNGLRDNLTSITVNNTNGTADQPGDISSARVWYQASGGAFDVGSAVLVGTMTRIGTKEWRLASINHEVVNGSAFYVTLNIADNAADNRTTKFGVAKNGLLFSSGATGPPVASTNTSTQTIVNPAKILASFYNAMPEKINRGQEAVSAGVVGFRNTGSTAVNITGLKITAMNHSGAINADTVFGRVVVSDGATEYASFTAVPSNPQMNVAFSPPLSVAGGGAEKTVTVYLDIIPAANTYDAGIRLNQNTDIVSPSSNTIEAYSGFSFPMETSRGILTNAVASLNASFDDIIGSAVTKGQQGAPLLSLTFAHPESVTTYADCVIKGVTITAASTPSYNANQLFSALKVLSGGSVIGQISSLPASDKVYVSFAQNITISAGEAAALTITADILPGITAESFNVSVAAPGDIASFDGSSESAVPAAGALPFTGSTALVQSPASGINVSYVNRMPAVAARGQENVHSMDMVFTHPNSGAFASVEIRAVTITVENELGTGIIPDSIMSKITILDSLNNTLAVQTAIPSSGTRVYVELAETLVVPAGSSRTAKIYISIQESPEESYCKLNINSSTHIRAVDYNGKTAVAVSAASGSSFPMKTSNLQVIDPATEAAVRSTPLMPQYVNESQQGITAMALNFLNPDTGIASVGSLRLGVFDSSGNSLAANSVISAVRIDNRANTSIVYAEAPVLSADTYIEIPFIGSINVSPGSANSVTANVKVSVAAGAEGSAFKIVLSSDADVGAYDYTSGQYITVTANNDVFPMESGITLIQKRAEEVFISYDPVNSGLAERGEADVRFMDVIFENPGDSLTSSIIITGLTLTAESGASTVNAAALFSKIMVEDKSNTALVYGQVSSLTASHLIY